MSEDRKYVRVYFNDLIRDYPEVWADDAALATWLRLLATADPMWPTPPELPRSAKARIVSRLAASGLLQVVGGRFTVKGLDTERTARQDAARNAAASRWHSKGNAEAMPNTNTSRAKQSRAEQGAPASPDPWDDPEHEALVWLAKHGCDIRPGNGYHRKLVTAVEVHGVNAIVGMLDRLADAGTKHGDVKGFLFGAIDALDSRSRPSLATVQKDDRADDQRRAFQSRLERTRAQTAELRNVLEKQP